MHDQHASRACGMHLIATRGLFSTRTVECSLHAGCACGLVWLRHGRSCVLESECANVGCD